MFLRLLAEVLEFWAQRGILTSQGLLAGLIIRTSVYASVFLALVGSYAVCQMDEGSCSSMSKFADQVLLLLCSAFMLLLCCIYAKRFGGQVPKLGDHPIPIMGDGTIFQVLAVAVRISLVFALKTMNSVFKMVRFSLKMLILAQALVPEFFGGILQVCIQNDEFCIENDGIFITSDELCIKDMDFVLKTMTFVQTIPGIRCDFD